MAAGEFGGTAGLVRVDVLREVIFGENRRQAAGATVSPYTTLFRSRNVRPHLADLAVLDQHIGGGEIADVLIEDGKIDRKRTRLNSSHLGISYAVLCLKKPKRQRGTELPNETPPAQRHSALAAAEYS